MFARALVDPSTAALHRLFGIAISASSPLSDVKHAIVQMGVSGFQASSTVRSFGAPRTFISDRFPHRLAVVLIGDGINFHLQQGTG